MYDANAGEAQFFTVDAAVSGPMVFPRGPLKTGLRKAWTHILIGGPGSATPATVSALMYDAKAGEAQFFNADGKGGVFPFGTPKTGWRKTWARAVPLSHMAAAGPAPTSPDLTSYLLYDPTVGEIQFLKTDGKGGTDGLGAPKTGVSKTWTHIVSGNFGGHPGISLFMYDAAAGQGQFLSTTSDGGMTPLGPPQPTQGGDARRPDLGRRVLRQHFHVQRDDGRRDVLESR